MQCACAILSFVASLDLQYFYVRRFFMYPNCTSEEKAPDFGCNVLYNRQFCHIF